MSTTAMFLIIYVDAARTNDIVIFRQLAKQRQSLASHPNIVDQIAVEVSDCEYVYLSIV